MPDDPLSLALAPEPRSGVKPSLAVRDPLTTFRRIIDNGRSRQSIMRVVYENLPALRYAYNRWLGKNPDVHGKMTVKFAIDEFGNVLDCTLIETGITDPEIANQIVAIVKAWRFDKIDKVGDITEVIYPLVFAM
jgi:hypothetical protein